MKKTSFIKIVSLLLVLCMLFSACSLLGRKKGDEPVVDPGVTGGGGGQPPAPTPPAECQHTNTRVRNAKVATCVTTGYTGDKVCTSCGTIVEKGTEIAITAHVYDAGMTTRVPTCMDKGLMTFTCKGCGISYSEELELVPHYDEYHDMLDGTHNHTCSTCTFTENAAHVPVDDGVYVAASCEESAYRRLTCSVCNGIYKVYEQDSEPTGHNYGDWSVVEATCVSEGYQMHTCLTCAHVETVTIAATPNVHNHAFSGYQGLAPSCNEGAVEVYVCTDCGKDSYTKNVPATGAHIFGEPVSSDDGWVRKTCEDCGYVVSSFDSSKLKEEGVRTETIPNDVPLSVTNDTATLEFPTEVIEQLKGGNNVKIDAGVLDEGEKNTAIEKLSDAEKARLQNVEIYNFTVEIDGVDLADHFAKGVTVTIPYELRQLTDADGNLVYDAEGNPVFEDKDGIIIWYVDANGTITKIDEGVVYNAENGTVTFLAPHFSMYAVAYEETQEMKCRRGKHDYELIGTVAPTCAGFGFSTYKCTCCHRITVDSIQEKLLHQYGDLISAQPTCDSGDYDHKICGECDDILNVRYYRELGHQLDSVATCTTGSYCSRCERVAVPALGHSWSEWRVVVHAGPTTNGLRVRYCLRCGEAQESETASTGNIDAVTFGSYEEMLEAIYDLVVGVDKARVEFTLELPDYGVIGVTATVDKSGDDMLVLVELTADGEPAGLAFYKNGVILLENRGEYGTAHIDSIMNVSIDVASAYMQAYYNILNPYFEMGIATLRQELAVYIDILGEDINRALLNAGIHYTAEDLLALLDSIETVYAYVSLKLGYTTGAEMKDGVPVPTKADFVAILKAFMDSSTDGGRTTYTANVEEFLTTVYAALDWLAESCEKSVAEVVFEKFGDKIAQLDPSIQNAQTLAAYLKTKFPGTLKVDEALGRVEGILGGFTSMTLEDLYGIINQLAGSAYGEEFDIEAMLSEYYTLTLNDLFAGMAGDGVTAEQFYDQMIGQMQSVLFGEIYFAGGMHLGEFTSMMYQRLSMMDIDAEFSFTVDMYGKLLEVHVDQSAKAQIPNEDGTTTEMLIDALDLKITRDNSIKVTIPEVLKPADTTIQGYIDAEGNYVVTGIPEGSRLDTAYINGGYYANLEDILTVDTELSAKLGFDVYVTPERLWSDTEGVASLIKINGKYYNYTVAPVRGEYPELTKYVGTMDLFEFLENPSAVIPDGDDTPVAEYRGAPVYTSPVGYLMQIEGEWWVCEARVDYRYDKTENGIVNERFELESVEPRYKFREMFVDRAVELSSVVDDYYELDYWYHYVNRNVKIDLYLGTETYEFGGVSDSNGIRLIYVPNGHIEESHQEVYTVGTERRLSQYVYDTFHTYSRYVVVQMGGEKTEMTVEMLHLYKKAPDYYLKVADGVFLHLDAKTNSIIGESLSNGKPTSSYIYTNVKVSSLEEKRLSDGNVMYVVGRTDPYICGYTYGEVTYGYVQVSEKGYIRAYCLEQDGYIVDIVYEGCLTEMYVWYNELYDLREYITFENGNLVISKDLVTELRDTCTKGGDYIALNISASKAIGGRLYHYMFAGYIEFIPEEEITLPGFGSHGTVESVDIFSKLFQGMGSGDRHEISIYVDGNGDLVIEGAQILNAWAEFKERFPADPFLEYNSEMSQQTGLNIYSYYYSESYGTDFLFLNNKYYEYNWDHNYAVETKTMEGIIGSWRIEDVRYCYTIYPDAGTPEELHNKMVYNIYLTFLSDGEGFVNEEDARIILYGIVKDGKLQILTGAVPAGESLVTFEGYKPIDEYIASLEATVLNTEERERVIEGTPGTKLQYCEIKLVEPTYGTEYIVYLYRMPNGKYVYNSTQVDEYLIIGKEAEIPSNYILEGTQQRTFTQGVYDIATFRWVNTNRYDAVKVGDIFYDYHDYLNNAHWLIYDLEQFRQHMYNTDRVYRVYDSELGDYRYYDKFVPGQYFYGEDEIYGFVLPTDVYSETVLGYTEYGNELVEIVYYVEESIDPEIQTIVLSDGNTFYHIDGIGFVKLADNVYARAVIAYDREGNSYAECLYRRAYVYDHELNNRGLLKEYLNVQSTSLTIPKEMLEYMSRMPDYCYFYVATSDGDFQFNYYILEDYFRGEMGGDYGGDYGDKDYDDKDYGDKGYGK